MRTLLFKTLLLAALTSSGCHLAVGLDGLDPGEEEDDASTSSGAGTGGGTTATTTGAGGMATTTTTGAGGSGGAPSGFLGPPVGNYLVAGDLAGFAGPEYYVEVSASSTAQVSLTIQYLDVNTRQPVGAPTPYAVTPVVTSSGTELPLGTLQIPGEANPVSGQPTTVEMVVLTFTEGGPPCGGLDGMVTAPPPAFSIDGSIFAFNPVANVNQLPATPLKSCP